MILRDWEVWHTYSTYLTGSSIDLHNAARAVVASQLAACALHSDGSAFWNTPEGVGSGKAHVTMHPMKMRAKVEVKYDNPQTPVPPPFAREVLAQSTVSLFSERRVFLDEEGYLPQYVRFQLEPCDLNSSEPARSVRCYPTVKLYSSGVMAFPSPVLAGATCQDQDIHRAPYWPPKGRFRKN